MRHAQGRGKLSHAHHASGFAEGRRLRLEAMQMLRWRFVGPSPQRFRRPLLNATTRFPPSIPSPESLCAQSCRCCSTTSAESR